MPYGKTMPFAKTICREEAGFTKPLNSFMNGCQAASGSSSSKARKERLKKRRAERERKSKIKRWLSPWS